MTTNILLMHQNFPGQFKLLAQEWSRRPDLRLVAIGEGERTAPDGMRYIGYKQRPALGDPMFPPLTFFSEHVRRGYTVRDHLLALRRAGFTPDVSLVHPGWGDAMFLRDVFPATRLISFLEFYYRSEDSDVGFDPEFRAPRTDLDFVSLRNLPSLQAAALSDVLVSPTEWQAGLFPAALAARIRILHEGIDTTLATPGPAHPIALPGGGILEPGQETVTYVSRSLEPYRGFHVFMRSLPDLLRRRPNLQVLIAGKEEVSYGRGPSSGGTWKDALLAEIGPALDRDRVHFLGTVPYAELINLFRLSTVHVYLTYPFVLSWSLLEAMATGCAVVASDTGPLRDVVEHGRNGLLTDFFDRTALVESILSVLEDAGTRRRLAAAARESVVERYDFRQVSLPRYDELIAQRG